MENHQFKVDGVIWKLVEGKIVEVKIDNEVFIKKSSLPKPSTVKTPLVEPAKEIDKEIDLEKTPLFEELDRGETLAKNIHKNIFHEVIRAVKERKNQDEIKQIISKYHPGAKKETIATYTSNYKKYIIENYPELKSMLPPRKFKKKFEEKIELEDKKGKIIARLGHNTVFEWPLRAFKKAFKEERSRSYLEGIIQFYYDTNNRTSINTYISCYRRYINKTYKESDLKEINEFDESEDLYKLLPPLEKFLYRSIKSKEQLPKRYDDIKGRCIGHIGSQSIYENILTDIKTAIIENKTKNQIIYKLLKHYHPKIKKESLAVYYRAYIRWIHQEEKSPMRALSFERKKKKQVKLDDDIAGFDESYKRMVSKDEIKKVRKAIQHVELNYEPTTKNITKQTGFTEHRVRGTLHWMIDNNLVKMKYNENLIPTYYIIDPNGFGENDI